MRKEGKRKRKLVIGGVIFSIASFLAIPKITSRISNKTYQNNIKSDEIDFDNMGPEIVRKGE